MTVFSMSLTRGRLCCVHAARVPAVAGTAGRCLRSPHRIGRGVGLRWGFAHLRAFFSLRPAGRCDPGWRGRWESDSQVTCHPNKVHASTKTNHQHSVRTTTTTKPFLSNRLPFLSSFSRNSFMLEHGCRQRAWRRSKAARATVPPVLAA